MVVKWYGAEYSNHALTTWNGERYANMSKQFTVRYNGYVKLCNGYAESSQLCAGLVKRGIYPQIVIQYVADDWDEKRVDIIGQNGNEGLHYE